MSLPKISIVTPCYNQVSYLEETILSILNQKYENLEYIIIDGGSDDGTVEIIKKYERKITYWVSEKDRGLYHALQKGFEKCTGEIMSWLNSDDILVNGALNTVSEIFLNFKQIEWLTGSRTVVDEKSRFIINDKTFLFSKFDFLIKNCFWIQQESTFWRRELWIKSGGRISEKYRYAGDFELWFRFLNHTNLNVTDSLLGAYRMRSVNQLSLDNFEEYLNEVDCILKGYNKSKKERIVLKFYQLLMFVSKLLKLSIIFRHRFLISSFESKYFKRGVRVKYDRKKQKYIV